MITTQKFELPESLRPALKKAKHLEWLTIGYMVSVIAVMYLATGTSQAMKTAWIGDILSIVPAISFLIALKIHQKNPNKEFPYGYHRIFTVAFLTGSLALFFIGIFLVFDAVKTLITQDRATIASVFIFGKQVWLGWLMIAALLYSVIPVYFLGKAKLPLAKALHNKILFTDAQTQKADYMTGLAAIAGVLGIGLGYWWADAVAALFISVSVLKDGYQNLSIAITDIMDRTPKTVNSQQNDPLVDQLYTYANNLSWVKEARLRLRENGQVYFGEIFVVPKTEQHLVEHIETACSEIRKIHWKFHDIVIMPVKQLPA